MYYPGRVTFGGVVIGLVAVLGIVFSLSLLSPVAITILYEGLLIRSWDFNTRVTGVGITPEPEEWRRSQDEAQPEGLLSFAGTSAHSEAYQLK